MFGKNEYIQNMISRHSKNNTELEITKENEPYILPYSTLSETYNESKFENFDKILNDLCENEFNVVESKEDISRKEKALLNLNDILKTWMTKVNEIEKEQHDSKDSYARLLCFGSYKLGVSGPQGDIDAIVLCPNYVDREKHFFGILYKMFQDLSQFNDNIQELTSVNYTHSITPLIKMEFYGVSVDLLFAKMDNVSQFDGEITECGISIRNNLYNDFLMKNMDDKMKRSFNGFRNAEMILNSIILEKDLENKPDLRRKIGNYRNFLRCMKIFCKRKGIYENKFGYFGGITLAILCAKIFQLYPNYNASHLIERFFYVYGFIWDWNKWKVQVVEERTEACKTKIAQESTNPNFRPEFGFNNYKPRFMQVFTPAWPQMNSTYNVNYGTREVIINTYKKNHSIIISKFVSDRVYESQILLKNQWIEFFRRFRFFKEYDQFIEMIIVGTEEVEYLKWKGYIEAKIRHFCEKLDFLMNHVDFDMQIWPKHYKWDEMKTKNEYYPTVKTFKYCEKIYIGLRLNAEYENEIDITHYLTKFLEKINLDWNKENYIRNPELLNFYIYILDREDFILGEDEKQIDEDLNSSELEEEENTDNVYPGQKKEIKSEDILDDLFN